MKRRKILFNLMLIVALFIFAGYANAQTAAFTYQGKLQDGALSANGNYQFEFKLYDAASGGNQIGQTLTDLNATVSAGIFAVNLDFGVSAFDGAARYLEISVRTTSSGQPYTPLNPRQPVTSTPYAVKSLKADEAVTAATASNSIRLGGLPATEYVQTTDARMSDARDPLPSSGYYIQNGTGAQSSSNFNISGEGKANIFNAATQFNLGGSRILSAGGGGNLFVGANTGLNNTGTSNAFFGAFAGEKNTSGTFNSFFGRNAGFNNTTGFFNSFFGTNAGVSNTTGSSNTFAGGEAGYFNTSGASNAFFGNAAGRENTEGAFNAFFGYSAGKANTTGVSNSFFGSNSGLGNTTGNYNAFFGRNTGQFNTTGGDNSFIGQVAGLKNTTGSYNTALGSGAGINNTTGSKNIFIGYLAGQANTVENDNMFIGNNTLGLNGITNATAIGANAMVNESNTMVLGTDIVTVKVPGSLSVTGTFSANILNAATQYNIGGGRVFSVAGGNNTFAGLDTGTINTGSNNSFFGRFSGGVNSTGSYNAFYGANAGAANTTGGDNAFFGQGAGFKNTIGTFNTATGSGAGLNNVEGSRNTFVGYLSGTSNTNENDNTFLGHNANGIAGITNATAIGSNAVVTTSNTMALGTNAVTVFAPGSFNTTSNYKIGGNRVIHVTGTDNAFIGVEAGNGITSGTANAFFGKESGKNTVTGFNNTFSGAYAGRDNIAGANNSFFGTNAGLSNKGNSNSFFGSATGFANITGTGNSFFGTQSGQNNESGQNNSFVGYKAGEAVTSGNNNTFVGAQSGAAAANGAGSNNTAIGYNNKFAAGVSDSIAIGTNITVANDNSVVIGGPNSYVTLGNVVASQVSTDFLAAGQASIGGGSALDMNNIESAAGKIGNLTVGGLTVNGGVKFNDTLRANLVMAKSLYSGGTSELCYVDQNEGGTIYHVFAQCSSSIRYKNNIQTYRGGLKILNQLRPVTFNWKSNGLADVGFVAEEVNTAEPLLSNYDENGRVEGVKYSHITTVLVNSVKEQQAQIEAQTTENQQLRDQLKQQQAQIDALKALVCTGNPGAAICQPVKP